MRYIKKFIKENTNYITMLELMIFSIKKYTINLDGSVDVDGSVDLSNLPNLKNKISFKFGKVSGNFDIRSSYIETLEFCPYEVGGNFNCSNNKLINLIGSPSEVGGNFICKRNNLTSLEGMSLEIGGYFDCRTNIGLVELNSVSNIEGKIYCDYNVDISKFDGYCKGIDRT